MLAAGATFLRFCAVGVVGFAADASLTLLFTQLVHVPPLPSRAVAFLIAATATWSLNRSYTFRSTAGGGSWLPYVVLTGVGALINIGVYWSWLSFFGADADDILTGVALGSCVALAFNFFASRAVLMRNVVRNG